MLCDKRISVMDFVQVGERHWQWEEQKKMWAQVEQKAQRNLFSAVGVGAKTILFTTLPCKLEQTQAIRWQGQQYHITDIDRSTVGIVKVTAADVHPVSCIATRYPPGRGTADYQGTPEIVYTFPGVLVEKWAGYKQVDQYAEVETTMVLVTPKAISLQVGDVVTTGAGDDVVTYTVQIAHDYPHQREYELSGGEEA